MKVLAAAEAGVSHREIAVSFWGAARVSREWESGGWMKSRIKRRLKMARGIVKRYRELVAGG